MNTFFFAWLSISIIFLLFEIGHPGLFLYLSFFFGGLLAALVSMFSSSPVLQTVGFIGGSICALGILRFALKRTVEQRNETNVYALVGKRAVVVDTISNKAHGYVRVQNQLWMARSLDSQLLQKGEEVLVVDVRGAHVIVKKDQSLAHKDTL